MDAESRIVQNKIYHGDCLEVMKQWPSEWIDMVVTSPPYHRLRDYQVEGQLGLEKTSEEYIEKLVVIFREVRRVLRPWGTVWLNMGDNHASGKGSCRNPGGGESSLGKKRKAAGAHPLHRGNVSDLRRVGLKPSELCGIPGRLILALQADGWWRKSDIIWHKPAPMPESVNGWRWEQHKVKVENRGRSKEKQRRGAFPSRPQQDHNGREFADDAKWEDCPGCHKCEKDGGLVLRKGAGRPTVCYDYIFLLAKSRTYFYDTEAVRSPLLKPKELDRKNPAVFGGANKASGYGTRTYSGREYKGEISGANLRNVWKMATANYPEAHYATFPEELPRRCILAGTSHKGNCSECGMPWARVVKKSAAPHDGKTASSYAPDGKAHRIALLRQAARERGSEYENQTNTLGWRPSCICNAEVVPPVVLDMFFGSGTTGKVATDLGRNWVGIEINKEYIEKQAKWRTAMRGFHEAV